MLYPFAICTSPIIHLACVAGVRKGRGRELGRETTCEGGGRSARPLAFLSRLKLPFPSLSNACHAGYNTPCLLPQIFYNLCFQFLLDITVVPREVEENAYAKCWEENKGRFPFNQNVRFEFSATSGSEKNSRISKKEDKKEVYPNFRKIFLGKFFSIQLCSRNF